MQRIVLKVINNKLITELLDKKKKNQSNRRIRKKITSKKKMVHKFQFLSFTFRLIHELRGLELVLLVIRSELGEL